MARKTLTISQFRKILDELFNSGANLEEAIDYFDNFGEHDHHDPHEEPRDHDNGYSYSEQCHADRLDWARQSSCPIERQERRMGA